MNRVLHPGPSVSTSISLIMSYMASYAECQAFGMVQPGTNLLSFCTLHRCSITKPRMMVKFRTKYMKRLNERKVIYSYSNGDIQLLFCIFIQSFLNVLIYIYILFYFFFFCCRPWPRIQTWCLLNQSGCLRAMTRTNSHLTNHMLSFLTDAEFCVFF